MKPVTATCQRKEDIAQFTGQRCTLLGTYEQVDVRFRKSDPPVYAGHAAVRLSDGTRVMLEPSWSPTAIRPAAERERFSGQVVAVTGQLHARAPAPAQEVAQLIGPCMSPIEAIRAADKK